MKTIISQPPSTTTTATFRRQFFHTASFPAGSPAHNQLFQFLPGNINFADLRCKAVYKPTNKGVAFVNEQHAVVEDDLEDGHSSFITNAQEILLPNNEIKKYVEEIQSNLASLDDGDITPSAYDIAWVALIENVNGSVGPQFPSCLQWIVKNQNPDGSWGESSVFSACDRLLNTLACVVALSTWNVHPDKCQKGMKVVFEDINKIGDEKDEHLTPGFELVFPALIELARKLEIKLPENSQGFKEIYAIRDARLKKIPKKIHPNTPKIVLYSLEAMADLQWNWEEVLNHHQAEDGSICLSLAPTAFAFMQTKNQNCLAYLTKVVDKFNGGVPNVYPVDMFERSWMIDRLQRLGIAHHFRSEIKESVDHIYRYWDEQLAIGSGRYCNLIDLDDTCMAFRVLRTHGHQVSPDVFRHFEKNGEFMCFPGQSKETTTVMFNLYRASQTLFPGEKILDDAKNFSQNFLTEKRSTNELLDRWIITKDLPGEIGYALDVPWYASLPRLEARYYLDQYGGEDDVWIAKTLYRLEHVSNNKYLEMAKLEYNHTQAVHQLEWKQIQEWYANLNIDRESVNTRPLRSYYEAAATIFEPERYNERVAWAKTTIILDTITSIFATGPQFTNDDVKAFIDEFIDPQHDRNDAKSWHKVMSALQETIDQISSEALVAHGVYILPHLRSAWKTWLLEWQKGVGATHGEAELIVRTINMSSGRWFSEEILSHPQYQRISAVTNDLCHQISYKGNSTIGPEIESKMQQLVQLVFCHSPNDLDPDLKQIFFKVAKTFYYRACIDPETINLHIDKVLFQSVV